MEVTARFIVILTLVSSLSIVLVLTATLLSVGLVVGLRSFFALIVRAFSTLSELAIAFVAAITSGGTVTLSVLVAAGSSAMAVPACFLELRVAVAVAVSIASITGAAGLLFYLAVPGVDMEIAVAVTSAAALAVGCASAWAVGVMSLIEKETQHVGLKMTSILDAVHNNKHFLLRLLVKFNSGLRSRDRDLDLALIHAVKAGFVECTEILLGSGANPNAQDTHGNTPLIHSCEIGSLECAKLLINVGCDVNTASQFKSMALHHAARWGYKDCVELLIQQGAAVNAQDGHWRTPLMLAALHARDPEIIMNLLIEAGCDVNVSGLERQRALHYAASRGLDIKDLLRADVDINAADEEGNQALHYAALEGHDQVLNSLLEAGSDPNSENFSGRNPLHFAATRGHLSCLKALIEYSGYPCITDPTGRDTLCYAVENNHTSLVLHLIQYNCIENKHSSESPSKVLRVRMIDPIRLALTDRNIHLVKALVIGGFPYEMLFDWLNHTPEELWVERCNEHVSWLREFTSNAPSLFHLCRIAVRNNLGSNVPRKVLELHLPIPIKEYLWFKDLDLISFDTK